MLWFLIVGGKYKAQRMSINRPACLKTHKWIIKANNPDMRTHQSEEANHQNIPQQLVNESRQTVKFMKAQTLLPLPLSSFSIIK